MTLQMKLRKTFATAALAATIVGPLALAPGAMAAVRTDIDLNDGSPSIVIENPDGADIMTLDAAITLPAEGPTPADGTGTEPGGIEYRDEDGNVVDPVVPADGDIDRSDLAREGAGTDADGNAPADIVPINQEIEPISAEVTESNRTGRVVSGAIGAVVGAGLGAFWQRRRRTDVARNVEPRALEL